MKKIEKRMELGRRRWDVERNEGEKDGKSRGMGLNMMGRREELQ